MADTKISALADVVTLAAGDKVPVADASDLTVSKSATMTEINAYLQTLPLASAQITALGAAAALAGTNTFPVDQSGTAKEALISDILTYLQSVGLPKVMTLGSQYTNATTTGTSVAGLKFATLTAGNYFVRWALLMQTTNTGTVWSLGVNYTGTVTRFSAHTLFPSAGVTAATGTMHDAANATTGQVHAYANTHTESTTTPNMGPWVGTTNANANHLIIVEAMLVVSDGGDLELYCASETGTVQISIEVGSSGMLVRTG